MTRTDLRPSHCLSGGRGAYYRGSRRTTALPTYPVAPVTRINLGLRFSLLTHISDRLYVSSIAYGLSIAMPQPHDILFRTLADPTRRAIFARFCRGGEETVGGPAG